jgi:hypothetical protein
MSDTKAPTEASDNGFFINNGTFSGNLTTPDGDKYDIRKLDPREVTDPRDGTVSTIWGGYASARDINLSAKDSALATEFKKTGQRPAELFQPESRDIPLYVTLRERPGAKGFTHIGSLWTSKGRYTVLARDLEGKTGLRFGGNVLAWKSPEALAAERDAKVAEAKRPGAAPAKAATRQPGGAV